MARIKMTGTSAAMEDKMRGKKFAFDALAKRWGLRFGSSYYVMGSIVWWSGMNQLTTTCAPKGYAAMLFQEVPIKRTSTLQRAVLLAIGGWTFEETIRSQPTSFYPRRHFVSIHSVFSKSNLASSTNQNGPNRWMKWTYIVNISNNFILFFHIQYVPLKRVLISVKPLATCASFCTNSII